MKKVFSRPTSVLNCLNASKNGSDFDIAHRPADFDQDDIRFHGFLNQEDTAFDLIGDVRNDLDSSPEIISAAFLLNYFRVNLTGGEIADFSQADIDETLIVAEVEVGLSAIVQHEYFSMLVGGHGAGIDVDVRIKFLYRDRKSTLLQHPP